MGDRLETRNEHCKGIPEVPLRRDVCGTETGGSDGSG